MFYLQLQKHIYFADPNKNQLICIRIDCRELLQNMKNTDEKYRKTELEKGEDINSDLPRGAAGHFDQKLSVLDVGPVFSYPSASYRTAVGCGARVRTPLQDVVGSQ